MSETIQSAFRELHAAWLGAGKRQDMNAKMDALAMALGLDPLTLKPTSEERSYGYDANGSPVEDEEVLRQARQFQLDPRQPAHFLTLCCGYSFDKSDCPVMWNEFNQVVQCHNCGHCYEPLAIAASQPASATVEKAAAMERAVSVINGTRNRMANAFNAVFSSAQLTQEQVDNSRKAIDEFWEADRLAHEAFQDAAWTPTIAQQAVEIQQLKRQLAPADSTQSHAGEMGEDATAEEVAAVAHIPDNRLRIELAVLNSEIEACQKLIDQHEGLDQDGMTSMEPLPDRILAALTAAKPASAPAQPSKCSVCDGQGWYPYGETDNWQQVQCEACLRTGFTDPTPAQEGAHLGYGG